MKANSDAKTLPSSVMLELWQEAKTRRIAVGSGAKSETLSQK
jgi:hypothetical protein